MKSEQMPDDDFWTRASYMRVSAEPQHVGEVAFTVHASDTVQVDVAHDGRVVGVECLNGPVGASARLAALAGVRVRRGGDDAE